MNMMSPTTPTWREPRLYTGYARRLARVYEEEPIVQVSLQLILSVFTVAFFIFFAIRPTLETIVTLQKKIKDQQVVNGKLDSKLLQLVQAQDQLAEYANDLPKIERAIPAQAEVEKMMTMLEDLAGRNDVWIVGMEVQGYPIYGIGEAKKGEKYVTFNVSIGGDQANLVKYLAAVENLERVVSLTQVSFAKPTGQEKNVYPLTVVVKGTMYYLEPANTANAK